MYKRRILEYTIVGTLIGILSFCVIYYSLIYDSLKSHQKINYTQDWFLIWMGIIFILILIYHTTIRWYKRRKSEELFIIFHSKTNIWEYSLAVFITMTFIFVLIIFFLYPGFIILSLVITMSFSLIVEEIPKFFEESGISDSGIKYKSRYYLWKDIASYSWHEGNKLIFKLHPSKILFWKYKPILHIQLHKNSQDEIDLVLKSKINKPIS